MSCALMVCCLAFLVSCIEVPPAWVPGDPPLRIWVPEDDKEALALSSHACAVWKEAGVGLECEWPRSSKDVHVFWWMADLQGGDLGSTIYEWQAPGWLYWTRIDPFHKDPGGEYVTAVHEMGHLLGIWEHVEEGPAVMTSAPTATFPTALDLQELGL